MHYKLGRDAAQMSLTEDQAAIQTSMINGAHPVVLTTCPIRDHAMPHVHSRAVGRSQPLSWSGLKRWSVRSMAVNHVSFNLQQVEMHQPVGLQNIRDT